MSKSKIWILALSGHGPSCLDTLVLNHNVMTFLMVDDIGGDTKNHISFIETLYTWCLDSFSGGKVEVEIAKKWKKLYPKLYKKISSIRPPGDLKSSQIRFSQHLNDHERGKKISELLFFRSENFINVKEKSIELAGILGFNPRRQERFKQFIRIYNDFLNYSQLNGTADVKTSVGNVFNTFLMCEYFGNDSKFFKELKRLKLLPKHVRFEFISKSRATLIAVNTDKTLIGEDIIDKNNKPIIPRSYTLADKAPPYNKEIELNIEALEEYFKDAEFIIIPPGSIANQLPLLNAISKRIIYWNKPIFWITNSFIHNGEPEVTELFKYFFLKQNGIGIKPIVLTPKISPYEYLGRAIKSSIVDFETAIEFINEYILQAKKPVIVKNLIQIISETIPIANKRTFPVIDYILQKPGEGGIRYDTEQLKRVFELIADIVRREKTTDKIIDFLRKIFGENEIIIQTEHIKKENPPPLV